MSRYRFNEEDRFKVENEFLGILSNFPDTIDKIDFCDYYFKNSLHKKAYRYLKQEKCMNYTLMLDYMSHDEAREFISNIYVNNIYTENAKDEMAMSFAKIIMEYYKQEQIDLIDEKKEFDLLTSDEYYQKLTDIKKLTCEPVIEELTNEQIDEMISDDSVGIRIGGFGLLSYKLKIGVTDLVTVAGTSGFGKSAFLLNIYKALSQSKEYKCHYFNLEVAPKMMIKRLLAITSNHRVDEFQKENIDKDFYINARNKIQDNNSYIASGSSTIEELKSKVLNSLDQEKINVVFVDHIGLLETNDATKKKEYDVVTYCIKELRNLALDNDLIIFVASQFDRASIKTGAIGLSSLKSSGEIENSSTHVLLLKESKKRETPEEQKKYYLNVEVDIAKNRNGETGTLDKYVFQKTKQIFRES